MRIISDLHTHSKYSDGRGTIEENVLAARSLGLEAIGISDHGPRNIGAGVRSERTYQEIIGQINDLNQKYPDIQVLAGAEADITSSRGDIDISPKMAKELDYLIVGLHPHVWPEHFSDSVFFIENYTSRVSRSMKEKTRNINTKALIEAVYRNPVDFVSHPDLKMPLDPVELGRCCANKDVALEINVCHTYPKKHIVTAALKTGAPLIVNSDAHFPKTVGALEAGAALLEEFAVPEEQVQNAFHKLVAT